MKTYIIIILSKLKAWKILLTKLNIFQIANIFIHWLKNNNNNNK